MARVYILYLCSLVLRSLMLGGLARLALLRSQSVELRHGVWTVVLCSMLLMPIADAVLPTAMVPASVPEVIRPIQTFIVVAPQSAASPVASIPAAPAARPVDGWGIGFVLGIAVSVAFLARFVLALCQIRWIKNGSLRIENALLEELTDRRVILAESSALKIPITVGFWKPFVILPSDWCTWEDWKLRAVLVHELTHIQRRDWAIGIIAAFAKCLFWFNPLAWWLERRLSSLAEQSSDEASVRFSGNPQRYAETLLQFAAAARQGHRWIGGVAMAQHKISLRIERVLALQRPGRGILSRAAWVLLFVAALPALYASAASQSTPAKAPALPMPVLAAPVSQPVFSPALTQAGGQAPAAVTPAPVPVPVPAPQVVSPNPPAPIQNPDLVGEIRLILAPVEWQTGQGGQVQIQTNQGTNRFTGTAVWNIQNSALNSWDRLNANAFRFALTGVQGRTVQFEGTTGPGGNGFASASYGCEDCSFLVWENGVGAPSTSQSPGIVFQLSADGKSMSATCRAVECRFAVTGPRAGTVEVGRIANSETLTIPVLRHTANPTGLTCFSVFGNVKLDGTPFTDADCPPGVNATLPATKVYFSVTR